YHLVEASLFPGDVMLPRFLHPGAHESYFAVAATDEPGMQSLCARIRSQLSARAELGAARVSLRVNGTPLRRRRPGRSGPRAAAEIAREIEQLTQIDSHWSN